jgi:hypothetical protein
MPSSDDYTSARDIDPGNLDILIPPRLAQELRKLKGQNSGVSYDRISCTLTIDGQDIQLPAESLEALLCDVLFAKGRPIKKKFDRDEVRSRWDRDNPESYKLRVVSDAASRLNKRIENVIRNEQPLIHPAGKSVGINPVYLS